MDKPRLIQIDAALAGDLIAKQELGAPYVFRHGDGRYWADADELRAWRLQHTSEGNDHGNV